MWARIYCFLIMFLVIILLSLNIGVSSRHLPPHHGFAATNIQGKQSPTPTQGERMEEKEEKYKKMGSRPPSCEHKCYGCMPCEAIQVPTTTASYLGVLYTNYEPEGWKCKCGTTFFTP